MTNIVPQLDSPRSVSHWLVFSSLVSIALILRVVGFQGYSDSDPRAYSVLANDLAHGSLHFPAYDDPPVFALRLGVYGPTAIVLKTFGLSELTLTVYPFVISTAGILLAYAVARTFYGPLAGLLAIGVLAVLPADVLMASRLYPDAIAAFWANVAVVFTYLGQTRSRLYQSLLYSFFGGVLFGISWLCKESVAYLVPFVCILVLFLHRQAPLRTRAACLLAVGLGSMTVLSAEVLFFQKVTGDPLFHFHATEQNYQKAAVWFFDQSSPYFGWQSGGYAKALAKRLVLSGPRDILLSFSALPVFAGIALVWSLVFKYYRRFAISGVWLVSLVLMFNFASSSFEHYRPLPTFERYLYPVLLPSVLLFAGYLARLLASKRDCPARTERVFWAWILIMVFVVHSASGLPAILFSRPEHTAREVAARVGKTDVIYTDFRTARNLVFFRTGLLAPSTTTTIAYENIDPRDMKLGAYVLIEKNMTDFLHTSYKYEPPGFVNAPPKTWRHVWADGKAILFQIPRTLGEQTSRIGA